jgi:hypothetical protein
VNSQSWLSVVQWISCDCLLSFVRPWQRFLISYGSIWQTLRNPHFCRSNEWGFTQPRQRARFEEIAFRTWQDSIKLTFDPKRVRQICHPTCESTLALPYVDAENLSGNACAMKLNKQIDFKYTHKHLAHRFWSHSCQAFCTFNITRSGNLKEWKESFLEK